MLHPVCSSSTYYWVRLVDILVVNLIVYKYFEDTHVLTMFKQSICKQRWELVRMIRSNLTCALLGWCLIGFIMLLWWILWIQYFGKTIFKWIYFKSLDMVLQELIRRNFIILLIHLINELDSQKINRQRCKVIFWGL